MQALSDLLLIVVVVGGLAAMAMDAYRTSKVTPDPHAVLGREMRAVGIAVAALLEHTEKTDPLNRQLVSLKLKLLNLGLVANLSAAEIRLAYLAVRFQKSSLIGKLADRLAYASPNTIQDYKDNLFFIRKFEIKYREGIYISFDITEPRNEIE